MLLCVFQCGALLCRSLPDISAGAAPGRVNAAGKEEEKKQETEEEKEWSIVLEVSRQT